MLLCRPRAQNATQEHWWNFKKEELKKQESQVSSCLVWERGAVPAHSALILSSHCTATDTGTVTSGHSKCGSPRVKNLFLGICNGTYSGSCRGTIRSVLSEPVSNIGFRKCSVPFYNKHIASPTMTIASVCFLQLTVLTCKNRLYYFFHPNFTLS